VTEELLSAVGVVMAMVVVVLTARQQDVVGSSPLQE
jgi:hypothetical protein